MYLYETHVHSNNASACAVSRAGDLVRAYKAAGYTGLILTDHFTKGNTCVPRNLDWESRMCRYYDAYLEAKEEGEKLDFDVFFGLEQGYGRGKEILVYGIDLDFLLAHPEIDTVDVDTFADMVREVGGIVVHAHPHRIRDYIDPDFKPRYEVCDGIEVYNAGDSVEINKLGLRDAVSCGKLMTSGGDVHSSDDGRIGNAGIAFDRRLTSGFDFVQALKNGEGHILFDGDRKNHILEEIQ